MLKQHTNKSMAALTMAFGIMLSGCSSSSSEEEQVKNWEPVTHPASIHCVEKGGSIQIQNDPKDNVVYCQTTDDQLIEQTSYYGSTE
ncbi:DUF333 domain-containing protein [Vibrio sp.]|nr:DUF333 domain-containing protein [Vibrio sp.]